jgi:hypothetical protein
MVILLYILPLYKMDVCCDRCDIYLLSLVVIYLVICSIAGVRKEHSSYMHNFCSRYVREARRYNLYLCCPFIFCYLGVPAMG